MINYGIIKKSAVLIAILLIILAIIPFINNEVITSETLATSFVFLLIGIAYPLILYKPQWNKAVLFFEGLLIAFVGLIIFDFPYNYYFLIIGLIIILISALAYSRKLPSSILKFFYNY